MDAGEVVAVDGDHLEDVIGSSGHQVTFKDVRDACDGFFEGFEDFIRLAREGDLDKYGRATVHLSGVQ